MRIVIFGSNGQDGYYLNKLLSNFDVQILNVSRENADVNGNIGDFEFVKSIIRDNCPSYIFHFAANSTTRHEGLFENHNTISTGTLNILEAVRTESMESKIFLSGSAMQFKNAALPISEATSFEATSPYSVSRIHSTYAGRYYRSKFGLKVYTGFFFNHDSPLRSEQHVNQKIVKAAQRISKGDRERLRLGNIEVEKEFGYAVDTVEAVWKLVNQDQVFEAVIGTGKSYSIRKWLEFCFGFYGLDWNEHVDIDTNFQPEYKRLVSDPTLIQSIGWLPKTSFEDLAQIMLKY